MGLLEYEEIKADTGIMRTLRLSGDPIAVTYIDQIDQTPYFTLWWWLNEGVNLNQIINYWLRWVLPNNGGYSSSVPIVLEFWTLGEFHEIKIRPPSLQDTVFEQINNVLQNQHVIEHVLLNSQDRVVEFSFKKSQPTRCFCTFEAINLQPLSHFFSMYHENAEVRSQLTLLSEAYKNFNIFYPIPVYL